MPAPARMSAARNCPEVLQSASAKTFAAIALATLIGKTGEQIREQTRLGPVNPRRLKCLLHCG